MDSSFQNGRLQPYALYSGAKKDSKFARLTEIVKINIQHRRNDVLG